MALLRDLWHFEKRQLSPMTDLVIAFTYDLGLCATQKTTKISEGTIYSLDLHSIPSLPRYNASRCIPCCYQRSAILALLALLLCSATAFSTSATEREFSILHCTLLQNASTPTQVAQVLKIFITIWNSANSNIFLVIYNDGANNVHFRNLWSSWFFLYFWSSWISN